MWRKMGLWRNMNGVAASMVALLLVTPALAQEPVPSNQPKVTTQTEVLSGKAVSPMLTTDSATRMNAIADRYRSIIANGGFPKVSKGNYKKGSDGKGVVALNQRLFVDGYLRKEATEGEFAGRVTSATIDAITRFQRNMGLAATGKVDSPTLAALNVSAQERLRTIEANLARLETYSANLGERYLVVNIPAQQIETVNNGKVFSRHNAIVGRKERPTPVVMTALSDVNFNPYWNAPPSIIEKDIIPKMLSGTQILTDMNIKVFQGFGGPEIDPNDVDWGSAIADDYHFRQEPGPANAMATSKINFPSPFGIYLHDTPEKHLFKNANRFYSSGCVRVEKVELLLEWVLNGQEGIGRSEIGALAETLERRDVKLTTPPQLRVAYLTAWPVGNTVAFRSDVYGLDGTGFTVGQPLPEGEVSEDGQKFVLKPQPRKPAAVDAAEAEGFGLFGKRSNKPSVATVSGKNKPKRIATLYDDGDISNVSYEPETNTTQPTKKLPFAVKKKSAANPSELGKKPEGKSKVETKKAGKTKDFPGLFDWAAYRKEQKLKEKKPTLKVEKAKKKGVPKKGEAEVSAVTPKAKIVAPKKVIDEKAVTKKPDSAKTPDVAKKPDIAKKPAVVETKKVETPVKKIASACKPGVVTKDCKAPTPKKP
jgi:L,D-transpeptidase YcbB